MNDDIEKIKARIKKLFALSKSPNANEAAVALAMAQDLMRMYGVSGSEIGRPEIIAEDVPGNGGKRPTLYENRLAHKIAGAFGCRCAYGYIDSDNYYSDKYGYEFIGVEHRVKIASFIAQVLLRKLRKARAEYLKTLKRTRSRHFKTVRADEFCLGWVSSVAGKLNDFANTPDEEAALDALEAQKGWGNNLQSINRKPKRDYGDHYSGWVAGNGVVIQHGVEGEENGTRLLRGAV
jgi:hypothetical protein